MTVDNSIEALARMTDDGRFERIATAVLRIADPLCSTLSHPGVNATGKTRKSPLDGVGFVRDADPPHLVAVHHTTTALKDLEKKWLHDPVTVVPRKKGGKPTAPAGDLLKTAQIIDVERKRTPNLRATLILTTNEEPGDELVRATKAAGLARRIEVDVWSRSRLAHVLDTNPTGQWIRGKELGIQQERLSGELLGELSRRSLEVFLPLDNPKAWIPRGLERVISTDRRPVTFLVAGSGLGKSVACHRTLEAHVGANGYGLVLSHEIIARTTTLDLAVTEALRELHPPLAQGQSPFEFCSPERPLLVIVEDVSRSGQPQRLVEKVAGWAGTQRGGQPAGVRPWKIICPVWPDVLAGVPDQVRRMLEPMLILADAMSPDEGKAAVIARAALGNRMLSDLDAEAISTALGHDPLLIALHDVDVEPDPHEVLGQFVEGALGRTQLHSGELSADLRSALTDLAKHILLRRRVEPDWSEVGSWGMQSEAVQRIKRLALDGELLRLGGSSTKLRLLFRHDRVRDWLLIESAAEMEAKGALADPIVEEPFFAEIIGAVLVRTGASPELTDRVQRLNPLALFQALRLSDAAATNERAVLANAIEGWLAEPVNRGQAKSALRWQALSLLAETEGPEILRLVGLFPERGTWSQLARLRNGDLGGGIELCVHLEPGVNTPYWEQHISHAKARFGNLLIQRLDKSLRDTGLLDAHVTGLVRLAGHVGEPALGDAIKACWEADGSRDERLADYLWAFARCCDGSTAAQYLGPVCAAWAALPDETEQKHTSSPRNSLASDNVRWAFQQTPPTHAIDYFVHRAEQADLRWQITYMLHGVDHSKAVSFTAHALGRMLHDCQSGFVPFSSSVVSHWHRVEREGLSMSHDSREPLLHLWKNVSNDRHLRIAAFEIWAATQQTGDLDALRSLSKDEVLASRQLRHRLQRGDEQAIPALIEKLRDFQQGQSWWFCGRHVWSAEMSQTLDDVLGWRRHNVSREWCNDCGSDWHTYDILMRRPVAEAERLLIKHWDHLRFSAHFVQVALYVGTPQLSRMVAEAVAEAPEPGKLFTSVSRRFGVGMADRPRVLRRAHILALEPYLDYFADIDLRSFADECNSAGWFADRKRLFDPRLEHYAWTAAGAAEQFDGMVARSQVHWIDQNIDRALEAGVTWSEYLATLEAWLADRRSFAALQLVASAVAHKGSRDDLEALKVYEGMPQAEAHALIEDTTYAVRRRTAQ